MRKLASFDDPALARSISEALLADDIPSVVRSELETGTAVWIVEENDVSRARERLRELLAAPQELHRFTAPEPTASTPASSSAQPASAHEVAAHPPLPLQRSAQRRPVTIALIAVSVIVALITDLGTRTEVVRWLSIASYDVVDRAVHWHGYHDLAAGQLWRLFTPIFLHFGFFHLFFNAWWLLDLGTPIERFQGPLAFCALIAWSALASNLVQFHFSGTPTFGGLSGVVYALVGYLWARGRFEPQSRISAPPRVVTFFAVWLALGFSGLLDNVFGRVANLCHLGGLIAGALYGYIAARYATRRLRSSPLQ